MIRHLNSQNTPDSPNSGHQTHNSRPQQVAIHRSSDTEFDPHTSDNQFTPTEHFVNLTDVRCYFQLMGQGEPLLLIPGMGATSDLFSPVSQELARHFTLIMPDLRGVGRSQSVRRPRHVADFSSDLIELVDCLNIDSLNVAGISFGGILAQKFACDHGSRVRKLILISTAHEFGPYLTALTQLLGHTLRNFSLRQFIKTMELLSTSPKFMDQHADMMEEMVEEKIRRYGSRRRVGVQLKSVLASSFSEAEYKFTMPTMVVACEYDPMIPSCYGRKMARKIPGSQFILIPDCGHNPIFEKPRLMEQLMTDFLLPDSDSKHQIMAQLKGRQEMICDLSGEIGDPDRTLQCQPDPRHLLREVNA